MGNFQKILISFVSNLKTVRCYFSEFVLSLKLPNVYGFWEYLQSGKISRTSQKSIDKEIEKLIIPLLLIQTNLIVFNIFYSANT